MDAQSEKQLRLDDLMPLIRERLEQGQTVCFSPRGTSMLPMLRQNVDRVVLAPLPEKLNKFDLPLYRRDNGQYVLHRITAVGKDYACIGDNQFTEEKGVRQDQMIGLVTGFFRGERQWSVEDRRYQIYCVLWHYSRPIRWLCRSVMNKLRRLLK